MLEEKTLREREAIHWQEMAKNAYTTARELTALHIKAAESCQIVAQRYHGYATKALERCYRESH